MDYAIKNDVLSTSFFQDPKNVPEEYVEEMYAADKLFPHHTINSRNELTVSKFGLMKAAAQLAMSKISDDKKVHAMNHLNKHYMQFNLERPAILSGEMADEKPVFDECLGEMLTDVEAADIRGKIPLNPLATDERIKSLKGEDAMDLIFRVYYKENAKGWIYEDSSYEDIVNTILTAPVFVPSCYGHQSQEAVGYEGRPLMGSVIGAMLDKVNGFIYYRIIPDSGDQAKDVRRWIRNKQINAVSIWGFPRTMQVSGVTHVINYRLRSVDFVPPLTEGQVNDGVSVGEMDVSLEDKKALINTALRQKYNDDDGWTYTEETYDNYIIASNKNELYRIPYTETDGIIALGNAVKVRLVKSYVPIEEDIMEIKDLSNDALLAEINLRAKEGRFIAPEKVAGEMGLILEDAEEKKRLKADSEELTALKAAAGEMGIEKAIETAKTYEADKKASEESKAFGEMVSKAKLEKGLIDKDGKPTGEMNAYVDKFAKFSKGMTYEQIAGEMDRVINDDGIKKLVTTAQKPLGEMSGEPGIDQFEM